MSALSNSRSSGGSNAPGTRIPFSSVVMCLVMTLAASGPMSRALRDCAAATVTVEPEISDEVLANPGMGWQTFGSFADGPANQDAPPSAAAYFRFTWNELEPEEGQIRFALIDRLLARARAAGQRLSVRVQCANGPPYREALGVPQWLKAKGCRGFRYRFRGAGVEYWVPDFADPLFRDAHLRFIAALGQRYDGHPDVDLLDIGSVGLWGEWHMSGTDVAMPAPAVQRSLITAWISAFPKTPKVINIDSEIGMSMARDLGLGWRADCLGDYGFFSSTWNHMEDKYPRVLAASHSEDLWKRAPVAFESCGDMRIWINKGYNLRKIFDYALNQHVSYFNNKSVPIPPEGRAEAFRLARRMGYRLVLKRLGHPADAARGSVMQVTMTWDNEGVAPPYGAWRQAVRLTRTSGDGKPYVFPGSSVKGWLPGHDVEAVDQVMLPQSMSPGEYQVAVGVVDPESHEPAVRLGIKGRAADGWYSLGRMVIR